MRGDVTVLLVDDDENVLRSIGQYLRYHGCKCLVASSAKQALEVLADARVEVVVTDIRMPGMDGIELVKALGAKRPEIGCIVMTGHPDNYRYIDIVSAGSKDFLCKPFDLEELMAKLERVLLDQEMTGKLRVANEELCRQVDVNIAYSELCRSLIRSMSLEEMSARVLESSRKLTQSPGGCMGVLEPPDRTLRLVAWDMAGMPPSGEAFPGPGDPLGRECSWFWDAGRARIENRFTQESQCRGLPGGGHVAQRMLAVPVKAGEDLLGLMVVADSPRDYTEADAGVMEDLAAIYAMAIRRKQDEIALEKANAKLSTLLDVVSGKFSSAERLLRRSMELVQDLGKD